MLPVQPPRSTSSATLELKPFQREDVAALRRHNYRALVANSPGTGKTIISLACVRLDRRKLTPALIIAPASVTTNWHREAKKWISGVDAYVITDTHTRIPRKTPEIIIISWSLLQHRAAEIAQCGPQFIIADEAHFAKNEDASRSKYLAALAARVPHMILLSGTPLINNADELDAIKSLFNQDEVPMIRRLLEDVVPEVPLKTRNTLPVILRNEDQREYRMAEEDFETWLQDELQRRLGAGEGEETAQRALAAEALVKSGYLRRLLATAKVPAALDWINRAVRLGEPVVVFCEHQEVVQSLQRGLKSQRIGCVTVDGSTNRKDRQAAIDNFQAGTVPVFIGTKAAKEGITLIRARHLLFVERYWTSAEEEQAEDRIRRIGQTRPTTIWFLHATGTIDDRMAQIIEYKRRVIAHTIGAAEIAESDEVGVLRLIQSWSETVASPFAGKEQDLGIGKPLPPLPYPSQICRIQFIGPKWSENRAKAWARLHGYPVKRVVKAENSVMLQVNDPSAFQPGRFATAPIAADIRAVGGIPKARSTRKRPPTSRVNPKR
jgi:SNF2 family DNA or RNA helicase